jgi:hypothetical protein
LSVCSLLHLHPSPPPLQQSETSIICASNNLPRSSGGLLCRRCYWGDPDSTEASSWLAGAICTKKTI